MFFYFCYLLFLTSVQSLLWSCIFPFCYPAISLRLAFSFRLSDLAQSFAIPPFQFCPLPSASMFSPLWLTLFQSLCSLYCCLSASVFVLTFVLSISSLAFCCRLSLFVSRVVLSVLTTVFYCTLFLSHSCLAPFVPPSSLCTTPYCLFVFNCCLFLVFFLAPPFCLIFPSILLSRLGSLHCPVLFCISMYCLYDFFSFFPLAVCNPLYFPPSRPTFVLI
jgi:hypothetical protein